MFLIEVVRWLLGLDCCTQEVSGLGDLGTRESDTNGVK